MKIDPKSLKQLRNSKSWSRAKLAELSHVSERQIARIEASKTNCDVREATLKRLANTLKVEQEALTGEKPPSLPSSRPTTDVQINSKISSEVILAFDLVGLRYGASHKDLIVLAPLLFTLLAEGSLAWRRKHLGEVDEKMEELKALSNEYKQLYFAKHFPDLEHGLWAEQESIEKADLIGNILRTRNDSNLGFADVDDLYAVTPFADYLCKFAADLEISGVVDFENVADLGDENEFGDGVGYFDDIWGVEPYQVCRDQLKEITGGSEKAKSALQTGNVRLSDIPKELMTEQAKEQRIAWLEGKYKPIDLSKLLEAPLA